MRLEERLKYILNVARSEGFVSISETAKHLDVSIETIRRDINLLCEENHLRKVRGGACPIKLSLRRDAEYFLRKNKNQQSKFAIGREAAQLIRDNSIVIFDPGVSVQSVATALTNVKNITAITNSVPTMSILLDKFSTGEITGRGILIGGEMDTQNRFTIGAAATETLDRYYVDISFVSCTALSEESVSAYNLNDCYFSAHAIKRATSSVLVAESEKLGKNSLYSFAKITDFTRVITDDENRIPEGIMSILEESDTQLMIARR